jgi:hypothetical protein
LVLPDRSQAAPSYLQKNWELSQNDIFNQTAKNLDWLVWVYAWHEWRHNRFDQRGFPIDIGWPLSKDSNLWPILGLMKPFLIFLTSQLLISKYL